MKTKTALCIALLLSAGVVQAQPGTWTPAELSQTATAARPRQHVPGEVVCTVGFVEMKHHEADEDVHAWVCGTASKRTMPERRSECVLGEAVPANPITVPKKGSRVRMCGRWVEADMPHGWTELHPVTSLEVLP